MTGRAQPSKIVGKVDGKPIPVTVNDCAQDRANAAGPAAAIEQRGQVNVSAQGGTTTHSRGLPDHHAGGTR